MDNLFMDNVGSLPFLVEPHCPRCCPASLRQAQGRLFALFRTRPLTGAGPCGNLSEMIPISVPTTAEKVIGLKSESVIGFIPES